MKLRATNRAAKSYMPLASLRCECGAPDVVVVAYVPALVLDMFVEARGEPVRGWCLACAARHGWLEAAA
jgi:hypothetical protein